MIYVFERFSLDPARRELRRDAALVTVEPQVFDLLHHLIRNRERVVGKDDLLATVWKGRIVSESTLSCRIAAARHALGDSGEDQRLIRTVARVGWRFVAPVRERDGEGEASTVESAPSPVGPQPPDTDRHGHTRRDQAARSAWLAAAGALGFVAGIGVWVAFDRPRPVLADGDPPVMSIAFPPFMPASTAPDDQRFAEALGRDLTTAAVRGTRFLHVASQDAAARFSARPIDTKAIRRELYVGYFVEGEVRRDGESLEIVARLIDTRSGNEVGSVVETESAASDPRATGEAIARLANSIRSVEYDAEMRRIARSKSGHADAATLVLRADALLDVNGSRADRATARKLYVDALAGDPRFVPALAGLYRVTALDLVDDSGASHDSGVKALDEISLRAVDADRDDPVVWHMRQDALAREWRWKAAFEANDVALRIDPYRGAALADRARLLMLTGRAEQALPVIDHAIALDDRSPNLPWFLQLKCAAELRLGNYDDAIDQCERALAHSEYWMRDLYLVAAYADKGDDARAAMARDALAKREPGVTIARLRALALSNDPIFRRETETQIYRGLQLAGIPN